MEFFKSNVILTVISFSLITFGFKPPTPSADSYYQYSCICSLSHLIYEIIVMEDDVMRVDINDLTDNISKIEIYSIEGQKVLEFNGCYTPVCSFDLSTLTAGRYNVKVSTVLGGMITREITMN